MLIMFIDSHKQLIFVFNLNNIKFDTVEYPM